MKILIPLLATAGFIWLSAYCLEKQRAEPAKIPVKPDTTGYSVEQVSQLNKLIDQSDRPDARRFVRAESGGNPKARNLHSSASGVLQFTDATWKASVRRWGRPLGIRLKDKARAAAQIAIGQKLAEDNAHIIARELGRRPTDAELYAAHIFGVRGGIKLIRAAEKTPRTKAARLYPRSLVSANRGLFYEGKHLRTVRQVCQLLNEKIA